MALFRLACVGLVLACANALVQSRPRFGSATSRVQRLSSPVLSSGTMRMNTELFGLALKLVEVPIQEDPGNYVALLKKVIPSNEILKWYISKIEDGRCVIEVVVMESE